MIIRLKMVTVTSFCLLNAREQKEASLSIEGGKKLGSDSRSLNKTETVGKTQERSVYT